jgi:chemotaxis protein CheD
MTAPAAGLARGEARPRDRARDLVVGIAELRLSADPAERLVTYALGSCLGIAIHDPVARVGGLLHAMLPTGAIDAEKARRNPAMFVDAGVPILFRESYKLGARKERTVVKVAGGAFAGADESADQFQIGKRNFLALRKLLWKNGVLLHAHDVGGLQTSRTVYLDVGTGALTIRSNGTESIL